MKIREVVHMKILSKSLMLLLLAAIFILSANAALQAVGQIDPANGFPLWYMDTNGLRLQQCLTLADGTTADPNCLLVPGPGFDPTQPIVFPANFPTELFW